MSTEVLPVSSFYSTHLTPRVKTFSTLRTRIAHTLGYPQINVEAHENQVNENISIACEMFAKYAGYTREYLVFNSEKYEKGKGIRVDVMMSLTDKLAKDTAVVPKDSDAYTIGKMVIGEDYIHRFKVGSTNNGVAGTPWEDTKLIPSGWDDLLDYHRKVIDVFAFEEGSSAGINTLFTIEQTLAQQTYFSYAMGNYGFDLTSWYVLKDWLDMRQKLLSTKQYFEFDERTQRLHIIPEPSTTGGSYFGAVGCYVEKSLRNIIPEPWVYQYALALTKINIGRIRGKYAGTSLFGGGSPNYQDLLSEGNQEKATLEEKLYTTASPGFGDADPAMFFIG